AQHPAADAGHAISPPLIRFHSRDFIREPASHLRTGIATRERLKAEPCAQFVPQRLTAAVIDPRVDLWRREAKRYVAKVGERRGAARPSDFRAVVYVGKTRRDRVEGFERTDQLAGREYFDVQPTPGQRRDRLRDALSARLQARQVLGPRRDHLEFAHALRNCGPWKGRCCGRGPYAGARNELAAIHDSLPVSCQSCVWNRRF